jgi:NAD(P)-dependent dehydrogenase (short-subunit alcohol dehydrogenase family)
VSPDRPRLLDDKVVVLSGGAGLLGEAFARAVCAHGAIAVVADVDEQKAQAVCDRLSSAHPQRAIAIPMDITSDASLAEALRRIEARAGGVHALVNTAYPRNAAYGKPVEEVTYDSFCDNVAKHLGGYFNSTRVFARYFRQRGSGNIVNLASVYGVVAPRFEIYDGTAITMPVEYAAIKAGILHLTRYFARYYRKANVRVNCISPGGIAAGQPDAFVTAYGAHSASGGLLSAEDVSGTLVYLLSDLSAQVTGQNLVVDEGWTL